MFAESYTISQPYACDNLTVFLIHGKEHLPRAQFLTLQEALERKKLIVYETGNVNELEIENLSLEDVYVQAGDIVKGGLQDRVIAFDVVVSGGSGKIPIDAFCVEQGRWRPRRQATGRVARGDDGRDGARRQSREDIGEEAPSRQFQSSEHRVHTRDLKFAACVRRSQSEVWDKVSEAQDRLSAKLDASVKAPESGTSLQLSLENDKVEQRVERYLRELTPIIDNARGQGDVLGYAFAINGQVTSADLYGSKSLFRKLWPRLLKASAAEAVAEFEEGKNLTSVTAHDVKAYLNDAARDKAVEKQVTQRIWLITQETDKTILQDTCDQKWNGAWVHRACLVK